MITFLLITIGIALAIVGIILSQRTFTHFTIIYLVGYTLLGGGVQRLLEKQKRRPALTAKFIIWFLVLGNLITAIIEIGGRFISRAWEYSFQFFDFSSHFWFSIAAYLFYILAVHLTYSLFCSIFKTKEAPSKLPSRVSLILGCFLVLLPLFWKSAGYPGLPFAFWVVGFFLLSDYTRGRLEETSLLCTVTYSARNFAPLLFTFLFISIPAEYLNVTQHAWDYINLPFLHITLGGFPVLLLIGWIPLIGIWLNIYAIVGKLAEK